MYVYIYIYICVHMYVCIICIICICTCTRTRTCTRICILYMYIYIYRRKFRSQTSDNMKPEVVRVKEEKRREEKRRRKKIKERKSQKKEDPGARKGRKVAKHCVFPMICGSGGSKSRLAKAAGAEPAGQMRDEQLHAVVARSTFRSQNVQSTPCSDHFWKLRCRKSARRCGAKHISKLKCEKPRDSDHFWTFRCRFAWQAQGIVDLVKS